MQFVGGVGASLYTKNAAVPSGIFSTWWAFPRTIKAPISTNMLRSIHTTTVQFFAEIDEPIGIEDILPYAEFKQTRFYKEWVQPQGLADCINSVLDKSTHQCCHVRRVPA